MLTTAALYLIKSALALAALYLFTRLALSNIKAHSYTRALWLTISVVAFTLPLINIDSTTEATIIHSQSTAITLSDTSTFPQPVAEPSDTIGDYVLSIGLTIYLLGALWVFFSKSVSYIRLLRLVVPRTHHYPTSGEHYSLFKECEERLNIHRKVHYIIHNRAIAPMSWMNYVVVSSSDLRSEAGREIILHELSHVRGCHSIDVMFMDLMCIVMWFNPAAWLIKNNIKLSHEYLADFSVLKCGTNAEKYQLLLIKKAVGTRLYTMSNSLNHSNLKNRITMMKKSKSSFGATLARSLAVAGVALTATLVLNTDEARALSGTFSEYKVIKNFSEIKTENLNKPDFGVIASDSTEKITYIYDGSEISSEQFRKINQNGISSITVLKDKSNIAKIYGDMYLDSDGVILITSKKSEGVSDGSIEASVEGESENPNDINLHLKGNNTAYICRGKQISSDEVRSINPESIESITIINKDKSDLLAKKYPKYDSFLIVNMKETTGTTVDGGEPRDMMNAEEQAILDRYIAEGKKVRYVMSSAVDENKDRVEQYYTDDYSPENVDVEFLDSNNVKGLKVAEDSVIVLLTVN
ncbi:MAG: M56 family metallopeptidase [Rikenellaceae bacterium]